MKETAPSFFPEELVGLMLGQVPASFALFDADLNYIRCSDRWLIENQLEGRDPAGHSLYEICPVDAEALRSCHQAVLKGETVSSELERCRRRDGRIDWLRWSMAPWHGSDGQVAGILITNEVPTASLEDQLRTHLLDEELSLFIDIADQFALCMLDDSGHVTIWNAGAERMFGWSEAEALGMPLSRTFEAGERDRQVPQRQLDLARSNGTFRDRGWRVRKDGSVFLADITISLIERDGALPGGFGQIVRDITVEDTQSRSLEASSVLLNSILETVPDALIVIDERGIILSFSKAAEELFGYGPDEAVGQNVSMLMPMPERKEHDGYLARYRQTGVPHIIGSHRRLMGQRKDGAIFPLELRVGEAFGGGRRLFAGFLHDLSTSEATEARLHETRRELAQMARLSEMGTLATAIAHDLNQPLMAIGNIVQTCAQTIRDGDAAALAHMADALDEAGAEAMRAGEMIKRLRRFLSRGELERTEEDPAAIAREACELATRDATYRGIEWSLYLDDNPARILIDRVQIQQVLINLVRNAIEAIDHGGHIAVAVTRDGHDICFSVTDDGPGIAPDREDKLFTPFSTTKQTGMGLGLAICRTVVESHGGSMWHQRVASGGASFLFTIPAHDGESVDGT
ncbi:PAS domain-containing sensor histidine kinase [Croceicoccus mobilis]|uniref:PAS domain-containing sensor histidine kinase n=1 Tax=Croceicoccus mobilis TaxID=1703339 RepID=UPI001560217E|nr:PAS domain S-box protein [Croceicoccus mobilis]